MQDAYHIGKKGCTGIHRRKWLLSCTLLAHSGNLTAMIANGDTLTPDSPAENVQQPDGVGHAMSNPVQKQKRRRLRHGKREPIPGAFVPRFTEDLDLRSAAARSIVARTEALKADAGCDSVQRELIAERAAFVSLQLQTAEVDAVAGREFNAGSYTQMTNTMLGLLRALGLDRHAKDAGSLSDYLKRKQEVSV